MGRPRSYEMRAGRKISGERVACTSAQRDCPVEAALAEAELGFGVVDRAASDPRSSRRRDPAVEAGRPARRQEVVECDGDRVCDELRVERVFADRKRLVP